MNQDEKIKILLRINEYADNVLKGIDLQKTQISIQLEKLKPEMEKIANEYNMSVEDVFIMYMDLTTEYSKKQELEKQELEKQDKIKE